MEERIAWLSVVLVCALDYIPPVRNVIFILNKNSIILYYYLHATTPIKLIIHASTTRAR